ncbi:MAG: hypothetical protein ABIN94_08290 [Ferruginibacter sp.]
MLKQFEYKQFGFISFKNDETILEQLSQLTNFIIILFAAEKVSNFFHYDKFEDKSNLRTLNDCHEPSFTI